MFVRIAPKLLHQRLLNKTCEFELIDWEAVRFGGIQPALAAAISMAVVWKLSRHAAVAWLVGLSAGLLTGHLGLDFSAVGISAALQKTLQPAEARDWLPALLVGALAIELAALKGGIVAKVAVALRLALCLLLPWLMLRGSVYLPQQQLAQQQFDFEFDTGAWSTSEAAAWLGPVGCLLLLLWSSARLVADESLCRLRASLTTLVSLAAAGTVALSGSLTTGQLLGTLTAGLVGCGITAAALRLPRGPEAAAGPIVAVFGGVLVIARFLLSPELAVASTLLLLLAMAGAIGWVGPVERVSARVRFAMRTLLCVICLALVVVPAAKEFAASQSTEESNPYQGFTPQ